MAKPWTAVETSPEYQSLAPDKQKAAKQQYFNTVVAPLVPKEKINLAQQQFFGNADANLSDGMTPAEEWAQRQAPDSATMSVLQGAAFGAGDELEAAIGAADTGIRNMFTRLSGGKPKFSAGEAYDAMLDQSRVNENKFSTDYPRGSQFGLELLGGAATGGGVGADAVKTGATAIGRAGRAALTGAGFGAASGFASGEGGFENRAKSAGKGAMIGTATGTGLGVAGELTGPIMRGAGHAAGPIMRGAGHAAKAFRSIFQSISGKTPEEAAESLSPKELQKYKDMAVSYVKQLIHESGGKIENLTEDPAFKMGKPITGAEAIGPQGESQAASIARRAGQTGSAAESLFRIRGDERAARMEEDLSKAASLDVRHTQGHMEQLQQDLQAKNTPLYEKAYAKEPLKINNNKDFQAIAKQPNFQAAFRTAKEIAANRGREIDAEYDKHTGKLLGKLSWEDMDLIKRTMGANISRKHSNGVGKFISDDISRADVDGLSRYRDFLFKNNAEYKDAVAHGGEAISLKQAYDQSARLMDSRTTEHQFDKAMNDMSPAELEALKSGWVNDVFNKLNKDKLKPKDLNTPEFRAKATRLLGASQARQFVEQAQQELRMRGAEQRIPPKTGSATMGLLSSKEEADAKTEELLYDFGKVANRRGFHVAAVDTALNAVWNVLNAARTPEKRILRDEIGKLLLMKPDKLKETLEGSSAQRMNPKSMEIGRMILHMTSGGVGPTTGAITQAQESNND